MLTNLKESLLSVQAAWQKPHRSILSAGMFKGMCQDTNGMQLDVSIRFIPLTSGNDHNYSQISWGRSCTERVNLYLEQIPLLSSLVAHQPLLRSLLVSSVFPQ